MFPFIVKKRGKKPEPFIVICQINGGEAYLLSDFRGNFYEVSCSELCRDYRFVSLFHVGVSL